MRARERTEGIERDEVRKVSTGLRYSGSSGDLQTAADAPVVAVHLDLRARKRTAHETLAGTKEDPRNRLCRSTCHDVRVCPAWPRIARNQLGHYVEEDTLLVVRRTRASGGQIRVGKAWSVRGGHGHSGHEGGVIAT